MRKILEFNGENKKFLQSEARNKLLVGAPLTGKTYTAMMLIHLICSKYPGTRVLMARKSLLALRNSAIRIYQQVLKDTMFQDEVKVLGEKRPTNFIYSSSINEVDGKIYSGKSEIILSSIDIRGKSIGADFDIVYINEPCFEGLTLDEFLLITSRARLNNSPNHSKVIVEGNLILDGNGNRTHWVYGLEEQGFEVFNPNYQYFTEHYSWKEKEDLNKSLAIKWI